ncbi:extracellular alkaline serine protease [Colletotrichum costaricense]|uniref:Extracellular alkaline serine protease n=2 Tax=Colletotrichum acutatum species complex TaxID=2707335 RepID=A0AAJ0E224_9PEZI|nr:extracellular alkaline serine protease [Colletotrichum costaricense]XP_060376113.1 extracellular alkaline serine protease [Colletotrichum tamarilloi]KAK1483655.1 extracellular alkaline serine protease [Colletotrichum tamarilloi]KAK1528599.1 extracellular alkaline serine protease [Colletotrichum costaricense]
MHPESIHWSPSKLLSKTKSIIASIDTDLESWYGVSSGSSQSRSISGSSDNEEDDDSWVNFSMSSKAQNNFGTSQMDEGSRVTTIPTDNDIRRQRRIRRLPFTTIHQRLKKSHHVEMCLVGISEKLYWALVNQSACCARKHVARICLDGFPLHENKPNPSDARHLSLFLSYQIDLCSLLASCASYREGLSMTLYQLSDNTPVLSGTRNEDRRTTQPAIALGHLIDRKIFSRYYGGQILPVNRATMCLNLSLALMHLSSETWLGHRWSVDNIYFLHDPLDSPNAIQQLDHPYLSRSITGNEFGSGNQQTQAGLNNERANVLSFLQVVMEIMGGERVRLEAHADDFDLLYELRRTKDEVCRWYPEPLEDVILSCLAFCRSADPGLDPILHRTWIWREIVQPFEELANSFKRIPYQKVEWNSESCQNTIPLLSKKAEFRLIESEKRLHAQSTSLEHAENRGETFDSTRIASVNTWFSRLEKVNDVLEISTQTQSQKTRIAVIDTGIDKDDPNAEEVLGYKDFIDGDDGMKMDDTGHGTAIVDLIYRVYEPAEIFVARVLSTPERNETIKADCLVARAIDWALQMKVDIICIAMGFQSVQGCELQEAIAKASQQGKLVFAAAANESHADDIAYPARYSPDVFCMFSTDAGLKNSRSINPRKQERSRNFAILGEDIKLASGKLGKGTSFSTAIASGFAASLLDFSRQSDRVEYLSTFQFLSRQWGMRKVFSEISIDDLGFDCICPWYLISSSELRQQVVRRDDLEDLRDKQAIRESIHRDLFTWLR